MNNIPGKHTSIWLDTTPETNFSRLKGQLSVDVAIIGGGIAGLSTAYLLKKAGKKVAVIESQQIVKGTTGYSTAKVTSAHGLIYTYLIEKFGYKKAQMYADANQSAVEKIASIIDELAIDADFKRLPAYTYGVSQHDVAEIKEEVKSAEKLGLPVSFTNELPLPFPITAAIEYENQARYHPRKYLLGLSQSIDGGGSFIFEQTRVIKIEEDSVNKIITDEGEISASDLVIASNSPIYDPNNYFAKLTARQSLVIAVRLLEPVPQGMFYSLESSFHSLRPQPYGNNEELLMVGGELFKTGEVNDLAKHYQKLIDWTKENFDVKAIEYHWTTNDGQSQDRVPLIGRLSPGSEHAFVCCGFNGWGMTHGTVAGMILSDLILGKSNPWVELYNPSRPSALLTTKSLSENIRSVGKLIKDKLVKPLEISELKNDEAKIFSRNGEKVAVYKDESGKIHAVSAVCTHMGCTVGWNNAEKTWDCPCHGSRFELDGKVIHGPAVKDLEKKNLS